VKDRPPLRDRAEQQVSWRLNPDLLAKVRDADLRGRISAALRKLLDT